jgi:pyrimidine-specific ribonucleoside hydrolase
VKADKWLFDVVQPWMETKYFFFGVRGFIPFDCSTLGVITHPEYFTYYKNIPIKVNYKKNDALKVVQFRIKTSSRSRTSSRQRKNYAIRALQGFEKRF